MLPWHPPSGFSTGPPSSAQEQQQQHAPPQSYRAYQQQLPNAQHQQPMQQQQQQQQQQPGQPQGQDPNAPPQPAPAPPTTLASVMHFLQTEHRRYAKDRNEWEIERAEMRARIALLEGEKRGNEGALRDLGRRCKMLENALRGERSKFLSTTGVSLPHGGFATSASGTSSPISLPPQLAATANKVNQLAKEAKESKEGTTKDATAASSASESGPSTTSTQAPPITISATAGSSAVAALLPGQGPASRASSSLGNHVNGNTLNLPGGGARDPRGRARSRDYLKQCLQEITYLTSSTTLNPLAATSFSAPNIPRPRKTLPEFALPPSTGPNASQPGQQQPGIINLPIPTASEASHQASSNSMSAPPPPPSHVASAASLTAFPSDPASSYVPLKRVISSPGVPASGIPPPNPPPSLPIAPLSPPRVVNAVPELEQAAAEAPSLSALSASISSTSPPRLPLLDEETTSAPSEPKTILPSTPAAASPLGNAPLSTATTVSTSPRRGGDSSGTEESEQDHQRRRTRTVDTSVGSVDGLGGGGGADAASRLTAIFRPESDESWRERLREAGENLRVAGAAETGDGMEGGNVEDKELQSLEWDLEDQDEDTEGERAKDSRSSEREPKGWSARKTLRSHLDGARSVAFAKNDSVTLVSGGDDMVVKLWRLDEKALGTLGKNMLEAEPQVSYRLHTAPVTSVIFDSTSSRIYSASLDSTINVFALPPPSADIYAPRDDSLHLATLSGHSNAVWGLALTPDDTKLISISADGTTKVWDTTKLEQNDALLLSWDYAGLGGAEKSGKKKLPAPTSLVVFEKGKKVAVAYQDSVVKVFDVGTGKELLKLKSNKTCDGTPGTQINDLVAHPTLPLIFTAHEDRSIRVFDYNTGECTRSSITHLDAVTSLALDPSGKVLASVGHDNSLRLWDVSTLSCIQELSAHRSKSSEGVLDVSFHPSLPFLVTAGADGTLKLWGHST